GSDGAGGVERAADDVVAHAGKVLHTTSANEHDAVLLKVVSLARDVRGGLDPVGEAHAGDLPKRRVGLLRGRRVHAGADASLLGAVLQGGRGRLRLDLAASVTDELVDRRHEFYVRFPRRHEYPGQGEAKDTGARSTVK